MNEIIIRNIEENDIYGAIKLIWINMIKNNHLNCETNGCLSEKLFSQILFEDYMDKKLKLIGSFYQDELIGVLGFEKDYISFLYVEKEYQNHKIGTLLFRNFLDNLKDNINEVYVDSSIQGEEFYLKLGFINGFNNNSDDKCIQMIYRRKYGK